MRADRLQNGDSMEAHARLNRLLNLAAERTDCAHFGLLVGRTVVLEFLGDVGRLAATAADVGSALRDLAKYYRFHSSAAAVWLNEDAQTTSLNFAILDVNSDPAIQFYAGIGAAMCSIVHALAGSGWSPVRVCLPFKRPADVWPYRNALRSPLEFDCETASIVFDTAWLRRPTATADADLHRRLEAHFRELTALTIPDIECVVRGAIRVLLATGDVNLPAVATALSLHPRTLERRLAQLRLSFRELVEDVNRDLACQLLRDSLLPIDGIAAALQYSSAANFATAFRKWTGRTPTQFRRRETARPELCEEEPTSE